MRDSSPFGSCHSMAGTCDGCRFYMNERLAALLHDVGGVFLGTENVRRVELVQMCLEALLHVFGHARKFNPHTHPGVAGANNGARRDALLVDPEINPQRDRKSVVYGRRVDTSGER